MVLFLKKMSENGLVFFFWQKYYLWNRGLSPHKLQTTTPLRNNWTSNERKERRKNKTAQVLFPVVRMLCKPCCGMTRHFIHTWYGLCVCCVCASNLLLGINFREYRLSRFREFSEFFWSSRKFIPFVVWRHGCLLGVVLMRVLDVLDLTWTKVYTREIVLLRSLVKYRSKMLFCFHTFQAHPSSFSFPP